MEQLFFTRRVYTYTQAPPPPVMGSRRTLESIPVWRHQIQLATRTLYISAIATSYFIFFPLTHLITGVTKIALILLLLSLLPTSRVKIGLIVCSDLSMHLTVKCQLAERFASDQGSTVFERPIIIVVIKKFINPRWMNFKIIIEQVPRPLWWTRPVFLENAELTNALRFLRILSFEKQFSITSYSLEPTSVCHRQARID